MKRVLKVIAVLIGGIVVLVLVVVLVGALLPVRHEVSREVTIDRPPAEVWDVIADFSAGPDWRPDIDRVEQLPDRDGRPVWAEYGTDGQRIPYATIETAPPTRLVRKIADERLPFGGTWTFDLTPVGAGTRVKITERGEVRNPVFRFVSKFVIGHETFMERYLQALGSRFGQTVTPAAAG